MVILGLGNPGKKYHKNRHNIGARLIEQLRKKAISTNQVWKQKYFSASEIVISSQQVIVAAPRTFMNESGLAALSICTKFDIKPQELMVVYDDINLEKGVLRIRKKGSSGGHKGVQSIIDYLGTEEFPRIKMGIGMPEPKHDLVEYVLSDFPEEEKDIVQQLITDGTMAVELILNEGIEKAMAVINGKRRTI